MYLFKNGYLLYHVRQRDWNFVWRNVVLIDSTPTRVSWKALARDGMISIIVIQSLNVDPW